MAIARGSALLCAVFSFSTVNLCFHTAQLRDFTSALSERLDKPWSHRLPLSPPPPSSRRYMPSFCSRTQDSEFRDNSVFGKMGTEPIMRTDVFFLENQTNSVQLQEKKLTVLWGCTVSLRMSCRSRWKSSASPR